MPFRSTRGFTFIETVLAISVATILATFALPFLSANRDQMVRRNEESTVGGIQTAIHLYGNESLVTSREPVYPPLLDGADPAAASPQNRLFEVVLRTPVTGGWAKEGPLTYRGPTGLLYAYNPEPGTFQLQDESGSPGPTVNPFGNVLATFGTIVFYDSGAILDTASSVAYLPDYLTDTVELTLLSGASIQTFADGSALITLPDGQEITVANIFAADAIYTTSRVPNPGWNSTTRYTAVGRGEAREGETSVRYTDRTSSYDRRTNTYHANTRYEMEGNYSGGSLNTDYGMIYENQFRTETPVEVTSSWQPTRGGGYRGSTEIDFEYANDSIFAYNDDQGEARSGYSSQAESSGHSRTDYAYNAGTGIYESTSSGQQSYNSHTARLNGHEQESGDTYEYEGTYRYNNRTRDYEGTTHYRHQDGRDVTYSYRYDNRSRSYEMTRRDNNSGEERRYQWQGD